jgi:short-subunit dehydrogenase
MIRYQDRWAVVTGASSGLGRGLAARLADRGMSLVLTGRNEARLNEAAHQIRFPRMGRVFLARRLSAANQAMFEDLARAAGLGASTKATRAAGDRTLTE